MMNRLSNIVLPLLISVVVSGCDSAALYKDSSAPTEKRVSDLVGRMTLEEKVGQLMCPYGWEMYTREGDSVKLSETFYRSVGERNVGMFWATFRSDPWTQKDFETGLTPVTAARLANDMQRYAVENTRLGIPLFLAEEAPHGHMAIGTTVFPTAIGQASTWNTTLIEHMARAISKEVRAQGGHISYGPVLDVVRDPRWSRTEESYGEDPLLTGRMGAAFVRGLGSADLSQQYSTVSTLKHFAAYGVSEAGQNGGSHVTGERELRRSFLPPFRDAVEAGARSVMTSYNSIDGIPCTANKYLIDDILKREWAFDGFVISDLLSIEGLYETHKVTASVEDAAILAINSGVDVDLRGDAFHTLIKSVREGRVSEKEIDRAVAGVLRLKFEMGLFENPYVDESAVGANVRTTGHCDIARRVAAESVVLLENRNATLPLSENIGKVAVIGPNADNMYNQLGDYTANQREVITVLRGLSEKISADRVVYAKGCAIRDVDSADIAAAVSAARQSDVAVVVVGGSSARDFDTKYLSTGAAEISTQSVSDMESGEGYDRASLSLMGRQEELLRAVKATGKPLVVVYIQGRPLDMNWASQNADALLCAWYPGQEGGAAIADVLFGDCNPAGRLPITIPRAAGQIPVYYNRLRPQSHDYVEMSSTALYPFGYGLSYSSFKYIAMHVNQNGKYDYGVEVTLRNEGERDGDEVVQLYLCDDVSSVVLPPCELRAFRRVHIPAGEERTVCFELSKRDFTLTDAAMNEIVEPGSFTLYAGGSSVDLPLYANIIVE